MYSFSHTSNFFRKLCCKRLPTCCERRISGYARQHGLKGQKENYKKNECNNDPPGTFEVFPVKFPLASVRPNQRGGKNQNESNTKNNPAGCEHVRKLKLNISGLVNAYPPAVRIFCPIVLYVHQSILQAHGHGGVRDFRQFEVLSTKTESCNRAYYCRGTCAEKFL